MTTFPNDDSIAALCRRVGEVLSARGSMLVAAESCTGGWLAKAITDLPGSSGWFERGLITYSNAAKIELLGVRSATLETYGAVSEPVVIEMAAGALVHSRADVAVAVSGIAGPDGGLPDKPVGTVWLAWRRSGRDASRARCFHYAGDREAVRRQAVADALAGVIELIRGQGG